MTMVVLAALLAVMLLAWLLLIESLHPKAPADPTADDPRSYVRAPLRSGPKGRAGAVALDEPEHDEPTDAYPPRRA